MSDISTMNSTAVAIPGGDPFSSYGAKVGVQGNFLTFKNGEFLYGQNAKELPIGTKLAANMQGLRIGWRRWSGGKPTDDLTVPLVEGGRHKRRDELGDNDPQLWDIGNDGKPLDPWQMTNILEMRDGEGEVYIYSTGSKGGVNAIGRLCKAYGELYRQKPGQVPIVELGKDYYNHPEYKRIYVPDFKIVGWADENSLTLEEEELPFDPPTTGAGAKSPAARTGAPAHVVGDGVKDTTAPANNKTRF
jgi:hypothetical protein